MASDLTCDVCNGESGGIFVGVASLTSGPMSVAFCNKCIAERAEPTFALDYLFIHVANGDINNLHPSVLEMRTWVDGGYVIFTDYVKRITPAMVDAELRGYEEAMRTTHEDSDHGQSEVDRREDD